MTLGLKITPITADCGWWKMLDKVECWSTDNQNSPALRD